MHGVGPPEWRDINRAIAGGYDLGLVTTVTLFQRAVGLEADGIAGPKTLAALCRKPSPAPPAADPLARLEPLREAARSAAGSGTQRAVAVAREACDLYIRETGGRNRGPLVDAIQLFAAGSTGYAWCAAFCDTCLRLGFEAAGGKPPLRVGVSCSSLVQRAGKKGLVFEPQGFSLGQYPSARPLPGDLLVLRGGETGFHHVGLVVGASQPDGRIPTIEGNTNDSGSAEGDGVYKRLRNPARPRCVLVRLG